MQDMDIHERLRWARERAGFRSAAVAAKALRVPYGTYSGHENTGRGIPRDRIPIYAKKFKVSAQWLLTGEGEADSSVVEVVGIVGAGGEVIYDAPQEGDPDTLPRPADAPPETVAVEIRGDSLGPGFDRWYALYARREDPVSRELVGALCVVGTKDGRTLVKWIRLGRKGYNLVSGNGAVEEDVKLVWGARVIDLKPRPH